MRICGTDACTDAFGHDGPHSWERVGDSPTVSEPRTEAGRKFASDWSGYPGFVDRILAIEAEAAQPIDVDLLERVVTHFGEVRPWLFDRAKGAPNEGKVLADVIAEEYVARLRASDTDQEKEVDWLVRMREANGCLTCGCRLTYPLEVQPDCCYPDCENCHESETAHRAAAGDR